MLDARPLPPHEQVRGDLMQPEDVAAAIMLCVNMPSRTLVEQLVMTPTRPRDMSEERAIAAEMGRP